MHSALHCKFIVKLIFLESPYLERDTHDDEKEHLFSLPEKANVTALKKISGEVRLLTLKNSVSS